MVDSDDNDNNNGWLMAMTPRLTMAAVDADINIYNDKDNGGDDGDDESDIENNDTGDDDPNDLVSFVFIN